MNAENHDFRKQYTKEEIEFQRNKMEVQEEFGFIDYMLWCLVLCIPCLGSVLGLLYIISANVKRKPWKTYIILGILPYVYVTWQLVLQK